MSKDKVEYSYSRGQAMGLAMGIIFAYPIMTAIVCIFAGWWGLVAYPIMVVLGVWSSNREARKKAESAEGAAFVPVSLKASPVEIELPNGGMVRLPLGVGQADLVEVIRAAGALRPWKAPKS